VDYLQNLTNIASDVTRVVVVGDSYNSTITDSLCQNYPNSYIYQISPESSNSKIKTMNISVSEAVTKMNDESIDLLYINSDMSKDEVNMWIPKLKQGGVISSEVTEDQFKDYFKKPTRPIEGGWIFIN
jgi:hypothetical protein